MPDNLEAVVHELRAVSRRLENIERWLGLKPADPADDPTPQTLRRKLVYDFGVEPEAVPARRGDAEAMLDWARSVRAGVDPAPLEEANQLLVRPRRWRQAMDWLMQQETVEGPGAPSENGAPDGEEPR